MSKGTCPKCGRDAPIEAVICSGCDFILDTSFLGDDITDTRSEERPGRGGIQATDDGSGFESSGDSSTGLPYEDALILGDLDDEEVESFQSADTGFIGAERTQARIYVGGSMQQLLNPASIPEPAMKLTNSSLKFTPFERHVLEYIDGKTDVGTLRKTVGLGEGDFFTAMATLADKGFIRLSGGPPKHSTEAPGTIVADSPSLVDELPGADMGDVFSSSREHSPLAFADSIASEERAAEPPPADAPAPAPRRDRKPPPLPGADAAMEAMDPTGFDDPGDIEEDVFSSSFSSGEPVEAPKTDFRVEPISSDLPTQDPESSRFASMDDIQSLETVPPQRALDANELAAVEDVMEDISLASLEGPAIVAPPLPGERVVITPPPPASMTPLPGEAPPLPGIAAPVVAAPVIATPVATPVVATPVVAAPVSTPVVVSPAAGTMPLPGGPTPPRPAPSPELAIADDDDDDAAANVPYPMRAKAEKLFEQAVKDAAAGKLSSAIMNTKIALIHNPHFKEAKEALASWESMPVSNTNPAAERERALVEQAQEAEARGMYDDAITLLDKALEMSPRGAALYNLKGVILATRMKRYAEASSLLMKAVEYAPGNATYKNNLGKVLVKEEAAHEDNQGFGKRKRKNADDGNVVIKKMRPKLF